MRENLADDPIRICLACNEDGYGPSSFGYYIVRELIRTWPSDRKLKVFILNFRASKFNRQIHAGHPGVEIVPVDSLIQLPKPNGEVHVRQALCGLSQYAAMRRSYADAVEPWLKRCNVAIDIGVPLFARAAQEHGVPLRLTVFDHSWAATLRLIVSKRWSDIYKKNPKPSAIDRIKAETIAQLIEKDERAATHVFLFENYITPPIFHQHWEKRNKIKPIILHGVLGNRVNQASALAKLNDTLRVDYGQCSIPQKKTLILVSPGGTPVWSAQLPRLVNDVLAAPTAPSYVLVFSIDLSKVLTPTLVAKIKTTNLIRYYGPLKGATQAAVLPAFERVITRAGGGIVNDALAARVGLAFVEEPQVQVKLIERECKKAGISGRAEKLTAFRKNPRNCIDRLATMPLPQPKAAPATRAEKAVVTKIRAFLGV
jgi:hypothetical protein